MEKTTKILRILVITVVLCIAIGLPDSAWAATVSDSASDDTFATANNMNIGDTANGSITETDDLDYYRFQLNSAGRITFDMTSYMQYYCIRLYDSDGEEIWYTDENEWTASVGYRRDEYNLYLEKGIYYMQVNGYRYRWSTYSKSTGKYECCTSFVSSNVNNVESDNSFFSANNITLGSTIRGQISENDDYDTFKFTLSKVGHVTLKMTSYMRYYCIKLYDSDGEEIWYTDENEWTASVGYRRDEYNLYLEKGTYYMQVNGYRWSTYSKSTGKYECQTSFISSGVSFDGDDNSFGAARSISWGKTYTGQISINDNFDTYKFVVPVNRYVVVNMTSYMKYYCIKIYDYDGNQVWYTDENEWNSKAGYRKDVYDVELRAGTYYMQVNGYRWSSYSKSTGKYVFSIAQLNQSNCNHKYVDKSVSETYFRQGYDLHKCEKCGKSYKDNYTAKKRLVQGCISVFSHGGKRKLIIQWNTVSDASGYQIRYCKSKAMKKGVKVKTIKGSKKSKKTIKNLSRKKKYYIQVRAYKKSGSNIVYGKWSAKKCLKTK